MNNDYWVSIGTVEKYTKLNFRDFKSDFRFSTNLNCSGQLIPDTVLSFSSAA
jgi:hypothetical protein